MPAPIYIALAVDPPWPGDSDYMTDKRKALEHMDPVLLSEACGPDAWSQSPMGWSRELIEGVLWRLLTDPLQNGQHPEYGSFNDAQIGRMIRIHAADYLNDWAERQ